MPNRREIKAHHDLIVSFLERKGVQQQLLEHMGKKAEKQQELMATIIGSKDRLIQQKTIAENLAHDYKEPASEISKRRTPLNESLNNFCNQYGIKPPIQLYFKSVGKFIGGHFACTRTSQPDRSDELISQDILQNVLNHALKQIEEELVKSKKEVVSGSHSSSFMPLEERLAPQLGRYPSQKDFESGDYYRNEAYHEEIRSILKRNKRCLLIGTPGCGKTSLALAMGYELSQKGTSVYYQDASSESNPQEWASFIESCDENSLVILDNAHASPAGTNNLLSSVLEHKTKLLITSRKVDRNVTASTPPGATHSISYIDILEKATQELQIDEVAVRHIINHAAKTSGRTGDKIGNIDSLIEKCKGDYNILRFYIRAWLDQPRDCAVCLSNVKETEILDDIYLHYLENKPYRQELLKISALSQLEIDVDLCWIGKKPSDELQKEGLILVRKQTIEPGRYVSWFRVYHPTVAGFFLKAAVYSPCLDAKSTEEFTLQCLKNYLGTTPFNFFSVFDKLHARKRKEWYSRLINDSDLYELVERIIQQEGISYIECNQVSMLSYVLGVANVESVDRTWIAEKLFKPLMRTINKIGFAPAYTWSLREIFGIERWLGIDIGTVIDFCALGKCAKKDKISIHTIAWFIGSLFYEGVPNDKVCAFCEELDFPALGKRVQEYRQAVVFTACIGPLAIDAGVSRKKMASFYNELDFQKLGRQASKDTTAMYFANFAQEVGVSYEKIHAFCEELDFAELGKVAREENIHMKPVTAFVNSVRKVGLPNDKILAFYKAMGIDAPPPEPT